MSLSSWRHFNFFEGAPIRDPCSGNEDNLLYSDPTLSAICAADERVFFAVTKSAGILVKGFDQDLGLVNSWVAYASGWTVSYMKYIPEARILITVAENLGSPVLVKLWSLKKLDKKTNQPKCQSTLSVVNGSNTYPISAFAISRESNILAFGYGDGSVILVRGDILNDRGYRQRLVYNSKTPITGLAFHENPQGLVTLYVTTVSKIITLPTNGKNEGKTDRVLDANKGADLGCVSLTDKGELLVGHQDALRYYTVNGHGPSIALSVPKKQLYYLNNRYIFIITSGRLGNEPSSGEITNNTLLAVDRSRVKDFFETTRLLIIDIQHKHVAFSSQISHAVKDVFMIWNNFYLLGTDGILYRIHERDINAQLDILVQRDLYDLAIELASGESSVNNSEILKIRKKYGDYLFNKGEYETAMDNYVKSITPDGASEIIIKYSDPSRITSLPKYLETLHQMNLATKDHITLLFNCYTRLGDTANLNKYIKDICDSKILDFDAVVKICRQSGYFTEAAFLAEKHGENELAVKIKLNDIGNIKECLNFIVNLEAEDVLHIMINHSRVLLDSFPNETTAILIELFTGKYVPGMKIGNNKNTQLLEAISDNSSSITAPVIQSYRAFMSYMTPHLNNDETTQENEITIDSKSYEPTYLPPQPRLIFSSFLNHPNEFIIFLEACISKFDYFGGSSKDKSDLLSTLFEMYLELASQANTESEKFEWENKAKTLGKDFKAEMDTTTLLLLSHLADFSEGQLLARDADGYQLDIFRAFVINNDTQGALKVLHQFAQDEKELYVLALSFFVSSEEVFNEVGEKELQKVLDIIRKEKLLSPLQVVQALSVNSVACISTIRDYLLEIIKKEKTDIENNRLLKESYKAETDAKRAEIIKLTKDPTTIQSTRCTECNTTMDLPAVHFLCKHSYHQRCLNEPSTIGKYAKPTLQCPTCLPDMEAIRAITRAQEDISGRHDLFKVSLDDSESKFMTVTDFFGRGAIENAGIV
ncbi:hypothetical protein NADFUDRAFT_69604 [Nadsonia fulvescens var. elongata DSM 6958]|uniref:E3 ubiquitin-protein ligase PEP5 n=1 Tax=Nadsonia fulvescens var. elongata DSM 6958 TaxID=857566 RepID=A0A1E3PLU6_9ASCO|nr:hypothetical protein NADFUDRAFT_69604 [Nadsonia fulvescens var. elongata DSM 6958]